MRHGARARRILIYGDFTWDRLASSYRRAFEGLGHEVVAFDVTSAAGLLPWWFRIRPGDRLCRQWLPIRRRVARRLNAALVDAARSTRLDLVFILNGDLIMPHTVAMLRDITRVFILHADNPFPSSVNHRPETLPTARECDVYFIWSRDLCVRLAQVGVARSEYLPFAWDPEVFPHLSHTRKPVYDVAFVGGWDPEREAWLDEVSARFAVSVWGPRYWVTRTRHDSPLRRSWRGELRGQDAADVIASSRITLNLLRAQNLPDGTNMRTFEVPGVGGLLASTRSRGASELFPENEAAVYFDTPPQLCELIERLLAEPSRRAALAHRAHDLVLASHRYHHRAERVLEVLGELG